MNYLIEPQSTTGGIATQCNCNCTVNFGAVKTGGGGGSSCGTNCSSLVVCVAPSGVKVSPTNA